MVTSYLWLAVCVVAVADALTSLPSAEPLDAKQIGLLNTSVEPTGKHQWPLTIPWRHHRRAGPTSYHQNGRSYYTGQDPSIAHQLCNFDTSLCNWEQDYADDFNWSREQMPEQPQLHHCISGKAFERGCAGGGYCLTSETNFEKPWAKTRLIGPWLGLRTICLSFSYSMHGPQVTALNVYVQNWADRDHHALGSPIWTISGDQGTVWHKAYIDITCHHRYGVIFEASRRPGLVAWSKVSLDNVAIDVGSCQARYYRLCTFDTDLCMWQQDSTDDFDWNRTNRRPPSNWTGPISDHNSGGTFFLYIETPSTGRQREGKARLVSMEMTASKLCMSLYFHTYGANIAHLNIYVRTGSALGSPVYTFSDGQGTVWQKISVGLRSSKPFKVVIEGTHGQGVDDGIAIDDVSFREGSC